MAQFLRPDGQISTGNWTGNWAAIDEAVASDADRAYSQDNPNGSIWEVSLSNPAATPGSGTITIRYRHAKVQGGNPSSSGSSVSLDCMLVQGGTVIATDAQQSPSGTWTTRTFTVSTSLVTDWTDLRLRFTAGGGSGSPANRRGAAVSWAELEAPDAPAPSPGNAGGPLGAQVTVTAMGGSAAESTPPPPGNGISFVGSISGPVASTDETIPFSSLVDSNGTANPTIQEGDTVIVVLSRRSSGTASLGVATAGYAPIFPADIYADSGDDATTQAYRKDMGPTPDSSVTITSTGFSNTQSYVLYVLRGVDPTTPLDGVTPASTTGVGAVAADPPAATPNTAGAWIFAIAGQAGATGGTDTVAFTNPANMSAVLNHFRAGNNDRAKVAVAIKTDWTGGAFNPDPFGGGPTASSCSVTAGTFVLKPASTGGGTNGNASGALLGTTVTALGGGASGTAAGSASGTLGSGVTVTGLAGSGTGAASRSAALPGATLTPLAGSASGQTIIAGNAAGALSGIALSATTGTATGAGGASGALGGPTAAGTLTAALTGHARTDSALGGVVLLSPLGGTISAGVGASGPLGSQTTASGPTASLQGSAGVSAPLPGVAVTGLAGTARGNAGAGAALATVTLTPLNGSATGQAIIAGNASGGLVGIALTGLAGAATGTASRSASLPGVTLTPLNGSASGQTIIAGNATGALPLVTLSAASGNATGGGSASGPLGGPTAAGTLTAALTGHARTDSALGGVVVLSALSSTVTASSGATGPLGSQTTASGPAASLQGSAGAGGALQTVSVSALGGVAHGQVIINATASGPLPGVAVSALGGVTGGGTAASGSVGAPVALTVIQGGLSAGATLGRALAAAVAVSPLAAAAAGGGGAGGALTPVALSAPTAQVSGSAARAAALPGVTVTSLFGGAGGENSLPGSASGNLASIAITPLSAAAGGGVGASGGTVQVVTLLPLAGGAEATSNIGIPLPGLSLSALGSSVAGNASRSGALPAIAVGPLAGQAVGGAGASAALPALSVGTLAATVDGGVGAFGSLPGIAVLPPAGVAFTGVPDSPFAPRIVATAVAPDRLVLAAVRSRVAPAASRDRQAAAEARSRLALASARVRIVQAAGPGGSMAQEWGAKDPDEKIEYAIDFAPALAAGDSLATITYSFVDQAGLVMSNERVDGTFARVRLAAGTAGENGKLRCLAVTAGGEELEEVVRVKVRNKL